MKVAFSGSGVLYPLHIGAAMALEDLGIEIKEVAGVSGGSIVAAALASGISAHDLAKLSKELLPSKLLDWSWKPWCDWGLIKGDKIFKTFDEHFAPTFSDTVMPLHVGVVELRKRSVMFFNPLDTPDMSIAKAIRASMSIPFVFRPAKIGDILYIDGGVGNNMPLDIFDEGEDVIGFRIMTSNDLPKQVATMKSYVFAVMDSLMDAADRRYIEKYDNVVNLWANISGLNFWIDENVLTGLIESGYKTVMEKYGVNTVGATCSICGKIGESHGKVTLCPEHGSRGFEIHRAEKIQGPGDLRSEHREEEIPGVLRPESGTKDDR